MVAVHDWGAKHGGARRAVRVLVCGARAGGGGGSNTLCRVLLWTTEPAVTSTRILVHTGARMRCVATESPSCIRPPARCTSGTVSCISTSRAPMCTRALRPSRAPPRRALSHFCHSARGATRRHTHNTITFGRPRVRMCAYGCLGACGARGGARRLLMNGVCKVCDFGLAGSSDATMAAPPPPSDRDAVTLRTRVGEGTPRPRARTHPCPCPTAADVCLRASAWHCTPVPLEAPQHATPARQPVGFPTPLATQQPGNRSQYRGPDRAAPRRLPPLPLHAAASCKFYPERLRRLKIAIHTLVSSCVAGCPLAFSTVLLCSGA